MTAFESPSLGLASVLPSHPWQSLFAGIRWSRLSVGLACTVLAGLSVHVVLQQVFHVPFPSDYPAHAWPVHIDHAAIVFGLLLLLSWTEATLGKQGFLSRWLVLFIVYSMLRETVRGGLMEGVVTTSYTYPMLQLVPKLATYLVLSFLCAAIQPRLRALWHYVLAASVIYFIMAIAIQPAVGALSQSALNHFAYLQRDEVFLPPYGVHVLIPAYLTFLEPAIACILVAALCWKRLRDGSLPAIGKFVVLMLLVRPGIFPPLINAFYHPQHRLEALLSAGQFSLETIALAAVAYFTWQFARPVITV